MSFQIRLPVRFGDCDPAGFVYYPVLFHYFHLGLEDYFAERCGTSYARLLSERRLGFPTVHVETDFAAPLVYGDEFKLTVRVAEVGTSSAKFEYLITRAVDGVECARSTQVHVCLDLDTRRAVPIPDWLRTIFESTD
jgi:YbgC/YbaW family acyl-CoA thioester hydrolase